MTSSRPLVQTSSNLVRDEVVRPRLLVRPYKDETRTRCQGTAQNTPTSSMILEGRITTRGHVRIMLGPLDARVYSVRYGDRHLIKQLPANERRWSRPLGCWITPTHVVDDVREWLEGAGYTVALVDVSNPPTRTALRLAATNPTPSETSQ